MILLLYVCKIEYWTLMDEYHPKPMSCKVDNDTWLIRFPSCDDTQEWAEQSAREYMASRCPNLIIDIRGNGGGRDDSYQPFLQLLFDTPDCSRDGCMIRYTEASIRRCGLNEERLKELGLPTDFVHAPEYVVLVEEGATFHYDSISTFPKKAAIIVDNSVASSGEQLVLAHKNLWARQHSRLRRYGQLPSLYPSRPRSHHSISHIIFHPL